MFNKSLLAISLLALSGAALSAPVANLKVTGTVVSIPAKRTIHF